MIRVLIVVLFLIVVLVWLLAPWPNRIKSVVSGVIFAFLLAVVVIEHPRNSLHTDLVSVDQIEVCGIEARWSYRSNYDINYCLHNHSSKHTVERLELMVSAHRCSLNNCELIEQVRVERPMVIAAATKKDFLDNLSFEQIADKNEEIVWRIDVSTAHARR